VTSRGASTPPPPAWYAFAIVVVLVGIGDDKSSRAMTRGVGYSGWTARAAHQRYLHLGCGGSPSHHITPRRRRLSSVVVNALCSDASRISFVSASAGTELGMGSVPE